MSSDVNAFTMFIRSILALRKLRVHAPFLILSGE